MLNLLVFKYNFTKKFNAIAIIALLSFTFVVFLGLGFSMSMDASGNMANCPWANDVSSVCPMNVNEHIANWQQLFVVNPRPHVALALLILLSAGITIFVLEKLKNFDLFTEYYQRYKQEHPDIVLFNYLNLAFADGILQPKIFA